MIARAALTAAIGRPAVSPRARSSEFPRIAALTAAGRPTIARPALRSLAACELSAPSLTRAPAALIAIVLGTPATVAAVGVRAVPPSALPASVGVPGLTRLVTAAVGVVMIAGAPAFAQVV